MGEAWRELRRGNVVAWGGRAHVVVDVRTGGTESVREGVTLLPLDAANVTVYPSTRWPYDTYEVPDADAPNGVSTWLDDGGPRPAGARLVARGERVECLVYLAETVEALVVGRLRRLLLSP